MKRTVSLLLAAATALSLAACGDKEVNTEDWRIVSLYQMVEPEKNGMFISDTYESLSFLDFSTMQQAPVCDDPTCKHQEGSCNSYGKNNHPFLYTDKLMYLDLEGEEHELEGIESEITRVTALSDYTYITPEVSAIFSTSLSRNLLSLTECMTFRQFMTTV